FPIVVKERAWACIEAMRGIARKHATSVARVALAWILSKGFVTSIIIGAKTIEQLNDNLGASALELSAAELASLDAISELPPEYPGWMAYKRDQSQQRIGAGSGRKTRERLLVIRPRFREGACAVGVEARLSWTPPPLLSVACGRDPAPCRGRLRSF